MRLRGRVALLVASAALLAPGCAPLECLHPDCSTIDSIAANVRLCGFPRDQVDMSGEVSKGVVRVGQEIPLRLEGDLERVVSVRWSVDSQSFAPNPPRVTLVARSNESAVLTGLATGGTHPADYLFVGADLVFRDGTEDFAAVAYCRGGDWIPADHIVVVP